MEAIYIEGIITEILPEKRGVSQKGEWVSQDYVLKTDEQYPKYICFTVWGEDKIKSHDIKIGEYLTVGISIESRQGRAAGVYFTSIKAWSVRKKKLNQQQQTQAQAHVQQAQQNAPQQQQYYNPPSPQNSEYHKAVEEAKKYDDADSLPF